MFFHASWCGQCKAFTPTVESVVKETGVTLVDVDADKDFDLCNKYGIMNLPVVIITDGEKTEKVQGLVSKDVLLDKINLFK